MLFVVPLVETPLKITVILLTPAGMLVKSIEVPDVEATAVPLTKSPTVPLKVGKVRVVVPATAGSDSVILPLVEPNKTIDIIFPYKITQLLPLGIVITTPALIVIGPTLEAFLPDGNA